MTEESQHSSALLTIQELQKIVENSRQIGIKQTGLTRIANILVDHARHYRTSCDFYKGYLTKIKVDILELIDEFEKMGYTVVSHRNGFGIVEFITVSWNTNTST